MPLYAFYCPACGQQAEAFLTMADRDAVSLAPVCPPGKQHRGRYRMVRLQTSWFSAMKALTRTSISEAGIEGRSAPMSQRGYIDLRGAFLVLFLAGVFIGGILFAVLPWLWRLLKPWLHLVTA